MRQVKQRRTIDCGAAALATATGASYDDALGALEILPATTGELLFALNLLTNRHWRSDCPADPLPVRDCGPQHEGPIILKISAPGHIDEPQHSHFVCMAREDGDLVVSDPVHSKGPVSVENYRRGRAWLVTEMLWCPEFSKSAGQLKSSLTPPHRYRDARVASIKERDLYAEGQTFGQVNSIDVNYVVVENLKKNGAATIFLIPNRMAKFVSGHLRVFGTAPTGFVAMNRVVALAREDNAHALREMRETQRGGKL